MLEKINTKGFETISMPCREILALVSEMKKKDAPITVAEIGVEIGATANS